MPPTPIRAVPPSPIPPRADGRRSRVDEQFDAVHARLDAGVSRDADMSTRLGAIEADLTLVRSIVGKLSRPAWAVLVAALVSAAGYLHAALTRDDGPARRALAAEIAAALQPPPTPAPAPAD